MQLLPQDLLLIRMEEKVVWQSSKCTRRRDDDSLAATWRSLSEPSAQREDGMRLFREGDEDVLLVRFAKRARWVGELLFEWNKFFGPWDIAIASCLGVVFLEHNNTDQKDTDLGLA